MGKQIMPIVAIVGCIVILFCVAESALPKNTKEIKSSNEVIAPNDLVVTSIIDREDEYNKLFRTDIQNGNYAKKDSEGIQNSIPSDYNNSTALIELRSFERKLDGSIQPFYLYGLGVHSKNYNAPGGGYGIHGYGLRLGLEKTDKREGLSELLWDTEYTVFGQYHIPGDPNNEYEGVTSKVNFKTPKSLPPGAIYRVDLILVDKIREKAEQEKTRIAKEERARKEKEETITLQFTEYPKFTEIGTLDVGYDDGKKSRAFEQLRHIDDNTFILKGPNKLGGELSVIHTNFQGEGRVWLYIKNVQKRKLQLPKDTSIVLSDDKMVTAKVSLARIDPNKLSDKKMIAFYPAPKARYFFFWIMVDRHGFEKLKANNWQTELKVLPGTYNVRLLENLDKYIEMGTVKFTNESGKSYTLSLK